MSPRPDSRVAEVQPEPTATPAQFISEKDKERAKKRREYFQMTKPFGLEQYQFNTIWLGTAHLFAGYCFYLNWKGSAPSSTILFELLYGYIGGLGITVGCHRYFTHKTFKANRPLEYLLMFMQTIANQYSIYKWSLDHRIHHKYTDTNSDPHNSKRGFWYSHVFWLVLPKHPEHKEKLETFEMPDLERNPVVRFQSKYYWTLTFLINFLVPISIIFYFWRIPLLYCIAANYRRYVVSLHFTWTVNSIAHIWGDKPYDKSISSVNNRLVALIAVGEGWHNYHHTFPWDYSASEFGHWINLSTTFIDFFAWLGWAHDLKTVSPKMLQDRLKRTGSDGSHKNYVSCMDVTELMKENLDEPLWGWDDEKVPDEFRKMTEILNPKLK